MHLTKEQKEWFQNMEPFKTINDIPDIPSLDNEEEYQEFIVNNLIRCGAIPKVQLEKGKTYEGTCRNAERATWNGSEFEYSRYKWGSMYKDTISHFEDELHYDVFIPLRKIG